MDGVPQSDETTCSMRDAVELYDRGTCLLVHDIDERVVRCHELMGHLIDETRALQGYTHHVTRSIEVSCERHHGACVRACACVRDEERGRISSRGCVPMFAV
jgi:hypothetical protein